MAESRISVLVVEDQPELLAFYEDAVRRDAGMRLAGAARTLAEAMRLIAAGVPDVVVVDLGLPDGDGADLIRRAAGLRQDCDILVVTVFGDDEHVIAAIAAGATGYLLKGGSSMEFIDAIRELSAGGSPISPSIARRLLTRLRGPVPAGGGADASPLSEREAEILSLIAKGLSFAEVGEVLSISGHTVVAHVKNIYRKLSVHSRGEAVYEARQLGILR